MSGRSSNAVTGIIGGLVFALVYVGLEILNENPEATNSISFWHFPLIWLLASIFLFSLVFAVKTVRGGKVRERRLAFSLSVLVALVLGLFWVFPMSAGLLQCFGGSGC